MNYIFRLSSWSMCIN